MSDYIKMNNAADYESIMIRLDREHTPIAFQNKLNELMNCGAFDNKEEAEKWILETPIEMELYYEEGYGMFLVEAEAIEAGGVRSPYSQKEIVDEDELTTEEKSEE